jgi:hypothetical protein
MVVAVDNCCGHGTIDVGAREMVGHQRDDHDWAPDRVRLAVKAVAVDVRAVRVAGVEETGGCDDRGQRVRPASE